MSTPLRSLTLLLLASVLSACDVNVEDGRVPEPFRGAAQTYVGTYRGEMDRRPGSIVLSMRDDGFVDVATPGFEGGDIYDVGCGSVIGPLESINGKKAQDGQAPILRSLIFGFHRSSLSCVAMSEIRFDFGHTQDGLIDIKVTLPLFIMASGATYSIFGHFVKE